MEGMLLDVGAATTLFFEGTSQMVSVSNTDLSYSAVVKLQA